MLFLKKKLWIRSYDGLEMIEGKYSQFCAYPEKWTAGTRMAGRGGGVGVGFIFIHDFLLFFVAF